MNETDDKGLLLGKHTPVVEQYAPELLYPIPRSLARDGLGLADPAPFHGADIWHAYELSWLDATGRPVARVGRFEVPATTPNIVESKSFKLYLNSLNNTLFDSDSAALQTICGDIGAAAGGPVSLQLFGVDDAVLAGAQLQGECIDDEPAAALQGEPDIAMLELLPGEGGDNRLYSHLLRSLCPVTGQPDWATVLIHWRGPALRRASLLRYVLAYRNHQEFHEQCVERMYRDLQAVLTPETLFIQAFYTRRGGLDINPWRASDERATGLPRLNRQ